MPPSSPLKSLFHSTRRAAARLWLNGFHRGVIQIGVTGSYGKTSTTAALYAVLSRHASTLMTDLNLDTRYNVPITALRVRRQHRHLLLELGIDSPGEMDLHLQIARPRLGILTGISPVHADADHLGSLEAIIQQKGRLLEALPAAGAAILNRDDEHVRHMADRTKAPVIWYGTSQGSDYRAADIRQTLAGTRFKLVTPAETLDIQTPLLGAHNALNLAGAAAAAHQAGVPLTLARSAFAELTPLRGRLNVEPGPNGLILINDALRANPASTQSGLAFLAALNTRSRKIAILGEMGELGDHAIPRHAEVGKAAAAASPDLLITVGELTRHTAEAARKAGLAPSKIFTAANVHEAANTLRERGKPGDVVYLKGSLMRHLERIPLILRGKTVGCTVISCPFYHQCTECEFIAKGYNPA
jgi:UDP-N-acetylmuramoyl-tripeptide--D-alanyl-D-alanine ligase